jgi:hypothetical protein
MNNWKAAGILVLFAIIMPLIAGCGATMQARSVDVSDTFLVNPKILVKGGPDQALLRYVDPAVDFKKYSKMIIDPVIIYKEGEMDADNRANNQTLANNLYAYLTQELGKDVKIVTTAEPGTMRLQTAIVNADKTKIVRNILTTVVPVGMVISTGQYVATGKPSSTGSITGEGRVTDAMTGQLLAMGVDKQVGGKSFGSMTDSWYSADEGMKHWAKMLRYNACTLQKGPGAECNAIKP